MRADLKVGPFVFFFVLFDPSSCPSAFALRATADKS